MVPFHELTNDPKVIFAVLAGKRPSRTLSCAVTVEVDSLWELLQKCWEEQAEKRPTAPEIVQQLVGPSIRATTTSSKTDWDEELTCRFRRSLQTQPLLPSVNQTEHMVFGDEVAKACKECFLDQQSSAPQDTKDFPVFGRPSKRSYEEGTSDSSPEDDFDAGNPAKRSKHSPEDAVV